MDKFLEYIFINRFNLFDAVMIATATTIIYNGNYILGIAILCVGAIISGCCNKKYIIGR